MNGSNQPQNQFGNISSRQIYAPAMPEGVVKWRMDTEQAVREFEHQLLGRIVDPQTGKYVDHKDPLIQEQLRLCNERGVAFARAILKLANKNTIQANIDEDMFERVTQRIGDTISEKIGKDWEKYGIKKEDRDAYVDALLIQVMLTLSRPVRDLEREHSIVQGQERISILQRGAEMFGLSPSNQPTIRT